MSFYKHLIDGNYNNIINKKYYYYYYYKLKNQNENVMFTIIMNMYEKICHAYFSSTRI